MSVICALSLADRLHQARLFPPSFPRPVLVKSSPLYPNLMLIITIASSLFHFRLPEPLSLLPKSSQILYHFQYNRIIHRMAGDSKAHDYDTPIRRIPPQMAPLTNEAQASIKGVQATDCFLPFLHFGVSWRSPWTIGPMDGGHDRVGGIHCGKPAKDAGHLSGKSRTTSNEKCRRLFGGNYSSSKL